MRVNLGLSSAAAAAGGDRGARSPAAAACPAVSTPLSAPPPFSSPSPSLSPPAATPSTEDVELSDELEADANGMLSRDADRPAGAPLPAPHAQEAVIIYIMTHSELVINTGALELAARGCELEADADDVLSRDVAHPAGARCLLHTIQTRNDTLQACHPTRGVGARGRRLLDLCWCPYSLISSLSQQGFKFEGRGADDLWLEALWRPLPSPPARAPP